MEMFGGHFGGSLDGIGIGFVEAPKSWHVTEFKTHNDRSFVDLCRRGVEKSKIEHFVQMQTYMGMSHEQHVPGGPIPVMDRAFYLAVNKNNDEMYGERVSYDGGLYIAIKEKARRVIFGALPPPRIANKIDAPECKWCDHKETCHGSSERFAKPSKNCRTCLYSTPTQEGKWRCEKYDKVLCPEEQRSGCEKHLFIPQLLPFTERVDASNGSVVYSDDRGNLIANYEGGELVRISSRKSIDGVQPKKEKEQAQSSRTSKGSVSKLPWE